MSFSVGKSSRYRKRKAVRPRIRYRYRRFIEWDDDDEYEPEIGQPDETKPQQN